MRPSTTGARRPGAMYPPETDGALLDFFLLLPLLRFLVPWFVAATGQLGFGAAKYSMQCALM